MVLESTTCIDNKFDILYKLKKQIILLRSIYFNRVKKLLTIYWTSTSIIRRNSDPLLKKLQYLNLANFKEKYKLNSRVVLKFDVFFENESKIFGWWYQVVEIYKIFVIIAGLIDYSDRFYFRMMV